MVSLKAQRASAVGLVFASVEQEFNGISNLLTTRDGSTLLEKIRERIQGATSQPSTPIKSFTITGGGLSFGL